MVKKIKKLYGVYSRKGSNTHEARAVINKKLHHIGSFMTDRDAALAHDIFLIKNHSKPENCKLNFPKLLSVDNLPAMPQSKGNPLDSPRKKRKPLSRTGERFIHREHYGFVFRVSRIVDNKREYHREKFNSMAEALKARDKYLAKAS